MITESIDWRFSSSDRSEGQAIRLFAGVSDGIEGLFIDQYGPFILVTLYNPKICLFQQRILDHLAQIFSHKALLVKCRDQHDNSKFQYIHSENYDKESVFHCHEGDLQFEIHTDPRHDFGLYLDTKAARLFLKQTARDKKVLNLFSYTCAFGIAALSGKASSVTNVDPNKDYLEWGKRNAELNNFEFKKYPDTTQDYLARHLRRLESGKDLPYDITVVDPPAFLVGRGSNRLARNMWPEWMGHLRRGGCPEFLMVINDKSLGRQKNLSDFFILGLGQDIQITAVEQGRDILGQGLTKNEDSYYFNPAIYSIKVNRG